MRRPVHRPVALVATLAAALVAGASGLVAVGAATPVAGTPAAAAGSTATDAFYTPPRPLRPAAPGALIRSRPAAVTLPGAPAFTATTVMYHSRTAQNADEPVTGTVFTPSAAWTGTGARPYVSLAVGTQGLGPQCAPSKQYVAGTEYEITQVVTALNLGWGVAVSDYDGYTTGAVPTYTVGPAMGHAVLDVVRAARQLPGAGVSTRTPLLLLGYSQGGGGAGWATSLQPRYAPELHLVAAATGGVPADLKAVGEALDGGATEAFLLDALIGLDSAYPATIRLGSRVNAAGAAAVSALESQCVGGTELAATAGHHVSDYTRDGKSLQQLEQLPGVPAILAANNLTTHAAPTVPTYQWHAAGDEVVALPQAVALHQAWCAERVTTRLDLVPGEHVTGEAEGLPAAFDWLETALAGQPEVPSCVL